MQLDSFCFPSHGMKFRILAMIIEIPTEFKDLLFYLIKLVPVFLGMTINLFTHHVDRLDHGVELLLYILGRTGGTLMKIITLGGGGTSISS